MTPDKVKLYTLIKLISYVKFSCKDFESTYFAGSPIVGEILADLEKQFQASIGKEPVFEVESNSSFGRTLLESIKWHIDLIPQWNKMSKEDQLGHIENLASPYILNQENFDSLLEYANKKHLGGEPI